MGNELASLNVINPVEYFIDALLAVLMRAQLRMRNISLEPQNCLTNTENMP